MLLISLLLISSPFGLINAKRKLPLMEDRVHRKPQRSSSECQFGKQHKELKSTWFPDLGPPFGVMHCIRCECVPVTKRNRVYGVVECRNIAKDCNDLQCDDQVQLPGQCCKICRNDTLEMNEMLYDASIPNLTEEEEKSSKHFGTLLTSITTNSIKKNYEEVLAKSDYSLTAETYSEHLAAARFVLYKRSLYFSVFTLDDKRPTNIHFLDETGSIIHEQTIAPIGSIYQNSTGKICGVWRRLSREYRKLLKEEKLVMSLLWNENDTGISGRLLRYRSLSTETFSSLMEPVAGNQALGSGATAILSISTVMPSVHAMVIFTGLANNIRDKTENSFVLKLAHSDNGTAIVEEVVHVDKAISDGNVIEISSALTASELEALAMQKITISLASSKNPQFKIEGKIYPRMYCELFRAILISESNLDSVKHSHHKSTRASGVSWMFINKNGSLQFYNTLDSVPESVVVELVTFKHLNLVKDLTEYGVLSGNGVGLSTKQLEQLYSEELALNVANANNNNPSLIRGQLVSQPVAESTDSGVPYLMKQTDTSSPTKTVGLIWIAVDSHCYLHYDLTLNGAVTKTEQYELYIEDIPLTLPGAPVTRHLLEEFNGPSVEGYTFSLTNLELTRLESGIVYLDLWNMREGQSLLRTQWSKVSIPDNCRQKTMENNNNNNSILPYTLANDEPEQVEVKCTHGSEIYEHGAQWTSTFDKCVMCNCNYGLIKCDLIVCPALNCSETYTKPGYCCPACYNSSTYTNDTTENSCTLGGQTFTAGSAWHPYIPPNGFDTCTTCICEVNTLKVQCRRLDCPALNCQENVAFRPDKKACCKVCPNKKLPVNTAIELPLLSSASQIYDTPVSDQQQDVNKRDRDILSAGGCKYSFGGPYENGNQWHPKIYSQGIITVRCVTCRCKDGKVQCERKKCIKVSCSDPCCASKYKCITRHKRHSRHRPTFITK